MASSLPRGLYSGVAASRLAISAIVPTLNEEEDIAAALRSLREGGVDEVIVCDGGSRDRTREIAGLEADRVVSGERGLASQLNLGAAAAAGDVLLFHYADVIFPAAGRSAIERVLGSSGAVGGAFRLAFASDRIAFRAVALGARLRNALGIGPFGDQSIFLRADVFRRIGGFAPESFLQDLDLVRRARRGGRFTMAPESVRASVRRWEANGFLRTGLAHGWLTFLYVLGRGGRGSRALRRLRAR